MIPGLPDLASHALLPADDDLHILVATRDPAARYAIADLLLETGFRVTTAATFGIVEIMLAGTDAFDVLVTAQSAEEIAFVGLPQLARSIDPDLPILVLDLDSVNSPAVVELVQGALSRWPLRDRETRTLH